MLHGKTRGPVAIVLGTRPEIIKLAKISQLLGEDAYVVHTGQHYDVQLSDAFFTEFGMRLPDTTVRVGGLSRGAQIGNGVAALDGLFQDLRPRAVVVQGDTNSVVAGSIAANANDLPLVHVEAGLRSFDKRMPEEHNRIIADHLSNLCLAPTNGNVANLADEGITGSIVARVGNPVVEAVERLMPPLDDRRTLAEQLGVDTDGFVLATFHRPENVDTQYALKTILEALAALPMPAVFPIHPRTRLRIEQFGLESFASRLLLVDPVGYRDFIGLGVSSRMVVSDSGGVQEEVSVYKKPAVSIRRSTERGEVEGTFVTRLEPGDGLAGELARELERAPDRTATLASLPSPFGTPDSPQIAVDAIRALIDSGN